MPADAGLIRMIHEYRADYFTRHVRVATRLLGSDVKVFETISECTISLSLGSLMSGPPFPL